MRVTAPPALRLLVLGIAMLSLLPACHTSDSKKPKRDPHQPLTYNERTANKKGGKKGNIDKVSQYDKALNNNGYGSRGSTKSMSNKSFSAGGYKGSAAQYSGIKDYQAKDFAGSKSSRAESQLSNMGSKTNRQMGKTFATDSNRWSGKTAASGNNKAFNGARETFQTSDFSQASKAIEKDKRPYFIPQGEVDKSASYDEDDVKRLLNRK